MAVLRCLIHFFQSQNRKQTNNNGKSGPGGDPGGRNCAVKGHGRGPGRPDTFAQQRAHSLSGCEDISKDRKQKTAEISERTVVGWGRLKKG